MSKYQIVISNYKKEDVADDVIYKFMITSGPRKANPIISEQDNLFLPSGNYIYQLYIIAITPQGDSYISPRLSFYENEKVRKSALQGMPLPEEYKRSFFSVR